VLEAALRHGITRVVHVSTGSVFGEAGNLSESLDEVTSPAQPVSLYGISKLAAERTALRYRHTRGLNLFPRFEYAFASSLDDCTVKRNSAARRSPMSIARIQRDAGYAPQFPLHRAFHDYFTWRDSHRPFVEATGT
jgi:nucleoside-diphosphate-sugar epimerase